MGMPTPTQAFVDAAWPRHDKESEAVFAEGVALVEKTEGADVQPLARLLFHVGAEHLGRPAQVLPVMKALLARATGADARALWRFTAAAHLCLGDGPAADAAEAQAADGSGLPRASDRGAIHALAAAAQVGQSKIADATRLFAEALAAASYGPERSDPLARALAVTSNNLASALLERPARDAAEDRLMLQAGEAARRFWAIAGDWIHVERAEYLLALLAAAVKDGPRALAHARTVIAMCEENKADAMERFFANECLARAAHAAGERDTARAARDAAAGLVAEVADEGTRSYCAAELVKLDGRIAG